MTRRCRIQGSARALTFFCGQGYRGKNRRLASFELVVGSRKPVGVLRRPVVRPCAEWGEHILGESIMRQMEVETGGDHGRGGESGKVSLVQKVAEVVASSRTAFSEMTEGIARLEKIHGDAVYSELLFVLAHLRMRPERAREHWKSILVIRRELQDLLGTPIDIRVALVHYFVSVNRKLDSPKVIELQLFQQTQASVYRDELTGLYNYRYFREHLPREIDRNNRHELSLSLIMVDIDDFKRYNDAYGHHAGNQALVEMGRLLQEATRSTDIVARYGGEEFVVMLPSSSKEDAMMVAERIRRSVAGHGFPRGDLTVSLGIATYPGDAADPEELVVSSDSAMYMAKSRGKNRVCISGDDRRAFRRIRARLEGRLSEFSGEFPFVTRDISEGGILFTIEHELAEDSVVEARVRPHGEEDDLSCIGRVVRTHRGREGDCRAAIEILNISQQDRYRLHTFLRDS